MTGSNRLLIGLGWPLVALAAGLGLRRLRARGWVRPTHLPELTSRRVAGAVSHSCPNIAPSCSSFVIASVFAFIIPITRRIGILEAVVLLSLYGLYLWRVAGRNAPSRNWSECPRVSALCHVDRGASL